MKKSLALVVLQLTSALAAFSQPPSNSYTTVSFKPDAIVGEDATLIEFHDSWGNECTPMGSAVPMSQQNFGDNSEFLFSAWTYDATGCEEGTTRELIRFSGLSSIPTGAIISSAVLVLRGPTPTVNWGNNIFPGTPLPNTNLGWLMRVVPGASNAWDENTVTWSTKPATDPIPANWVEIEETDTRWGYTQQIDVTDIVANIVGELTTDPDANNGFMLMLQNEVIYSAQCYASSDHGDRELWPELIVTYTNCHSGFSYCVSSDQSSEYEFVANNPNLVSYEWTVDGSNVGNSMTLDYDFNYNWLSSSTYTVCLRGENGDGEKCMHCIEVCGSSYVKNDVVACSPYFTYCTSTPYVNSYDFAVVAPSASLAYTWIVDGNVVGTGTTLSYTFPAVGDYEVTLEAMDMGSVTCYSYVRNFCVSPVYLYSIPAEEYSAKPADPAGINNLQQADRLLLLQHAPITISPNPAANSWTIGYALPEAEVINIDLFDVAGRKIKSISVPAIKGSNTAYLSAENLAKGFYFIEIHGRSINTREKVIKQ